MDTSPFSYPFIHQREATWAAVNNAAMDTGVQIFLRVPAFNSLGVYTQKWELLDPVVILVLIFWRNMKRYFYKKFLSFS